MNDVPLYARGLALLRAGTGNPAAEFRDGQWEAIEAAVERDEALLLVRKTGWGKSAVYFIATKLLRERGRGPTVVLSPLLALMRRGRNVGRRHCRKLVEDVHSARVPRRDSGQAAGAAYGIRAGRRIHRRPSDGT